MTPIPTDPDTAIRIIAEQVDRLSGQVAALIAYVAHIAGEPSIQKDVRSMQGLAQKLAPPQLAPVAGSNPALAASQGIEKIEWAIRALTSTR